MADVVSRRVTGTDLYSWMTPIEGRPGQWQHNTAARGAVIEVSAAEAERGDGLGVLSASDAARDEDDVDEVEDQDPDDDDPERPPLAANKDAWVAFRVAESEGHLTAEQLDGLTKAQLQDDGFVAGLLPA